MSHALSFPAPGEGLYRLPDDVGRKALFDQLSARQQQLHALLAMTCGDAWATPRVRLCILNALTPCPVYAPTDTHPRSHRPCSSCC